MSTISDDMARPVDYRSGGKSLNCESTKLLQQAKRDAMLKEKAIRNGSATSNEVERSYPKSFFIKSEEE